MPKYIRKAHTIEARQWDLGTTNDIAEWTAGRAQFDPNQNHLVVEQKGGALKRIVPGDYVVRLPDRTFIGVRKSEFESEYLMYDGQENVIDEVDDTPIEKKDPGTGAYTMADFGLLDQ